MVEAPPSKNHKTRIPFWHPRNNKPPCGSLVTTLLTSLRHAGGEADAISLLCFALIVYQTISDLSTGKSRNFFFFVNSFPRGGNTIFCTQTVPPWGQERRHIPCRRKTGRATRKTLRRSPTSRRTRKTTASKPAAIPYASGPEFPGRSACRKSFFDMLNKLSELYKSSENLGFQWRRETGEAPPVADQASLFRGRLPISGCEVSADWLEPTVYPFLGYLRAKSRLAAVALRNTPAGVVPHTPFLSIAENLSLYR